MNRLAAVLLLLPALLAPPGQSAEIAWRADYNKAVKEAAETGKPVVIVVGTDACHWCRQLDARTLRTDEISQLLNERFVVYKLDANREPELANALKAQVYPSIYFAGPTGNIVGFQEGFLEKDALKQKLVDVLVVAGTPDWMKRDFELAEQSSRKGDSALALKLFRAIAEDGKTRPIQILARKRMAEMDSLAAAQEKKAREMVEQGKTADALTELRKLDRAYPGTPAAREGKELMFQLMSQKIEENNPARELLFQARLDFRNRKFMACLQTCDILKERFALSPEAIEAIKLANEIRSNPEWTREACDELGEKLSSLYLSMAESYALKGKPEQAIHYLERITRLFPDSRQAELAKQRLTRLKGISTLK
jgi:thioredoxin-related protein